ncbi:MAG: hypothetical protein R3E32_06130 [Chitinophagales bacterium]
MELHLKIIGSLFVILAFVHVIFPKYFNWRTEFQAVSLINRQIMYVHTFFIALVIFLMGLLCLSSSTEITTTPLGNKIALGFAIFWTIRLVIQFFGYSSELWKDKWFETVVHILFSILWTYVSGVFWWVYLGK